MDNTWIKRLAVFAGLVLILLTACNDDEDENVEPDNPPGNPAMWV